MNDKKDYSEFLHAGGSKPSSKLTEQILATIRADLNPNPYWLFSKLLAIHSFTAAVTLSICPQFGFRVIGEGMGLMRAFMPFGEYGCIVACGAFFMGASLLVASLALKSAEIRVIRKSRWLAAGVLTLLSLGFFVMVDAEFFFGLTAAWLVGALFGGLATLELGWQLRFKIFA